MALTYDQMLAFIESHKNLYDSVVFDALVKSINELRDFNKTETNIKNGKKVSFIDYRKRLSKALDACNIYISDKVHKTPTDTKETLDFAKEVKDTLTPLFETALEKEKAEIDATMRNVLSRSDIINDNDRLKMLAKLQRNIGGSRIVAKRKQLVAKPSERFSFFRKIAHKVYTGLKAVGLAVGALLYDLALPFTPTDKYIKQFDLSKKTDNERIPGTKTETFENDKTLTKVNEGVDNQAILSDSRRMPLVFEKKIPEDPYQPPTMSLRFQQAEIGSSLSVTANQEVGHGFVALKYSKKNPITGKMERYECTFGFYPKTGVPSMPIVGAQIDEGLHIAGEVCDDYEHSYAVEKVYEVNNKTINKVILAAQQFASGGYNVVKRNCADFVSEMAKTAEIKTEQYMQKADFQSNILPVVNGLMMFGGPMMSRIGEHRVLKDGLETDYSYGNFGNTKIAPETVRKFSKTEFNIRTEGYSPSQIAEVIRADYGNPLSGRYTETSSIDYGNLLESINTDIEKFQAKLDKYAEKHKLPELKETNAKLREYMKTQATILYNDSIVACKKYIQRGDDIEMHSFKQQRIACKKFARTANTFKKDLSNIFYDTYKGDPELNLLFNSYISKINEAGAYMNNYYRKLAKELRYPVNPASIKDENVQRYYERIKDEDYADFVNFKRDDAQVIKDFLFQTTPYKFPVADKNGNVKIEKVGLSKTEIIAGIKMFGSLEQTIKFKRIKGIDANKRTKNEKKEFAQLEKKAVSYSSFIKSAETILERPTATKEDIEFAFSELPNLENPGLNSNSHIALASSEVSKPSQCLKGIIFGKTLQGLKEKLKDISPQTIIKNPNVIAETVGQFYAEKMNGDAFKVIIDVMTSDAKKDYPFNAKNDTEQSYKRNIDMKVYDKFMEDLTSSYLKPLMNEMSDAKEEEFRRSINADKNKPQKSLAEINRLSSNILSAFEIVDNYLANGRSKEFNNLVETKFNVVNDVANKDNMLKQNSVEEPGVAL